MCLGVPESYPAIRWTVARGGGALPYLDSRISLGASNELVAENMLARQLPQRRSRHGASAAGRVRAVSGHAVKEQRGGDAHARLATIAERLGEVVGAPLAGELRQLSSGASRDTYRFATAARGELVAQLDRRGGKLGGGPPPQAALLQAAARAGVPVAEVVAHGAEDPVLGDSWIVVQALPGTTDPRRILAGEGVPAAGRLIDSIAAALAAVHRMPADEALAPAVSDSVSLLRDAHDRLGQPHPTFELAFRALADGPPPGRTTFVHGDFRIGNLMVAPAGVSGVLDWELAHLGDPLEDLGWLCVPAWRFGRPDRPAAGLGTREQLIDAYARHSGVEVDREALAWWELAGTLRWGVICVMQAFSHLAGAVRSIEHAVIGRRACEVEWDLLELLDPGDGGEHARVGESVRTHDPAAGADSARASTSLHDRPTALELIDAARSTLGDELLPAQEGRASFQLRVTLRALGMVERELRHGEEHRGLRASALASLGVADETELASAIRAGEWDGREAQLYAALRSLVHAKLSVANPGYVEQTKTAAPKEAP